MRKAERFPGSLITRLVIRSTAWGALLWGSIFGLVVVSSSYGFITAYPTLAERAGLAATLGSNAGFAALLGPPHSIDTVAGFTAWRALGVLMIVGAVWAMLTATKTLRGEEELGRWELLLSGQTTRRQATAQALLGLATILLGMVVLVAVLASLVGSRSDIHFSIRASTFFAVALVSSAAEFTAVGVLMSQVAPTRQAAVAWSTGFFGISLMLRMVADSVSSLAWMRSISPLGWIEKLQPLTAPDPNWLLPIGIFILVVSLLAVYLAGRRDLGAGIVRDNDRAKPHTLLLGNTFWFSVRSTRSSFLGWLASMGAVSLVFGAAAKVVEDATASSTAAQKIFNSITSQADSTKSFLGFIFLLLTTLLMFAAASQVSASREQEAAGYVDNLLVRPVSRWNWLGGQVVAHVLWLTILGISAGVLAWVGVMIQHGSIPFTTMLLAGLNIVTPALLVLGIGTFVQGFIPRISSAVAYGIVAWSFLVELVGSVINASPNLLHLSIINHVALAPAQDIVWSTVLKLLSLAVVALLLGIWGFAHRDLMEE